MRAELIHVVDVPVDVRFKTVERRMRKPRPTSRRLDWQREIR